MSHEFDTDSHVQLVDSYVSHEFDTMAKIKRTKWQTMIHKTLHWKLKIELHEPHLKPRTPMLKMESSSFSTSSIRRATPVSLVVSSERGNAMQLHFSCFLTTTKFIQFYIDNFSVESRRSNFNSKEDQYSNRINYFWPIN